MVERNKTKTGLGALKKLSPEIDPSDALIGRIMGDAAALFRPSWRTILWPFGPVWKPAMALAFALVLGILAGFAVPSDNADTLTYEIETTLGS